MKEIQHKLIQRWLYIGFGMVFIQILLGAITRLSGSGLSITHWDIVTGVMFPLNDAVWLKEFELYKLTPQYLKINFGMSLQDFKFIYFWEYIHRLWARIMGFVFLFPFIYFLYKKKFETWLIVDLVIIIVIASFVATLGWIMVASGLINRPWVNAYKLSFHLCLAVVLLSYLFWVILKFKRSNFTPFREKRYFRIGGAICVILFVQLFLGGVMSGMKAGIVAPTWPDINGSFLPKDIYLFEQDKINFFGTYEDSSSSGIIIQFLHRTWGYFLFLVVLFYSIYLYFKGHLKVFLLNRNLILLILVQIIIGIFTVINCRGNIPLWLGVLHQFFGISCFLYSIYIFFHHSKYSHFKINRG